MEAHQKQEKQRAREEAPTIDLKRVRSIGQIFRRQQKIYRFRFPLSQNEAFYLLAACYEAEVNRRNIKCIFDTNTVSNLVKVADFITSDKPDYGLFLGGNYGRGKTIMMYAFRRAVNHLSDAGRFREIMGEYWKPQFEIYQAVDIVDIAKRDHREFKRICGLNMLGIDDLGVEEKEVKDYGNVMEPMMRLFEHRYNRQLFTVVTSNSTPKEQTEKFGERIADRLAEMFHVIYFKSEISYRRMKK